MAGLAARSRCHVPWIPAHSFPRFLFRLLSVFLPADNLQFFLSSAGRSGFDRFDAQERALDRFRAFASRRNVHVTLVIHPRKEPEDAPLQMSSVFGTAKATQEADSVLILQKRPADGQKYIDIRKNRYDGSTGIVPLAFDEAGRCFYEPEHVVQAPSSPSPHHGQHAHAHGASGSGPRWSGSQQSRSFSTCSAAAAALMTTRWTMAPSRAAPSGSSSAKAVARKSGWLPGYAAESAFHDSAAASKSAGSTSAGSTASRSSGGGGGGSGPSSSSSPYARMRYAMAVKAAQAARARLRVQLAAEVEADLQRMYARLDAAAAAAAAGGQPTEDGPVGLPPLLTREVAATSPVVQIALPNGESASSVVTSSPSSVAASATAAP